MYDSDFLTGMSRFSNYIGAVKVKQFTTAMVIMGAGRLLDKLKCEYTLLLYIASIHCVYTLCVYIVCIHCNYTMCLGTGVTNTHK